MRKFSKDQKLEWRYPDEQEISYWFENLPEELQAELHFKYEALVPDWITFLRRERPTIDKILRR